MVWVLILTAPFLEAEKSLPPESRSIFPTVSVASAGNPEQDTIIPKGFETDKRYIYILYIYLVIDTYPIYLSSFVSTNMAILCSSPTYFVDFASRHPLEISGPERPERPEWPVVECSIWRMINVFKIFEDDVYHKMPQVLPQV